MPTEIEGPHGITIDPEGEHWYLSLAHGSPNGYLVKYSTDNNEPLSRLELGLFPATMQISPTTGLLYVVNFNLHGLMKTSTVSVVDPLYMVEVTKIKTGIMPHGSRISKDGKYHYSVAMMSGELFEIDAMDLSVNRILSLDNNNNLRNAMHHSKIKPNKEDQKNIKKAINTLNKLGKYNFSQGTVVRNKKVIAIEGRDGTEKMLKKCKSKKFRNNGVLVKFPKKKQDLRIDLPTVGLKTLKQCTIAGLKGIVLKGKQNIFLDKNKCINWANKNKMFITVK